jgi:tartrate-resistant acid phosphatase type 5
MAGTVASRFSQHTILYGTIRFLSRIALSTSLRAIPRPPNHLRSLENIFVFTLTVALILFNALALADSSVRFAAIGDYGSDLSHNDGSENIKMRAVANLIKNKDVGFIITTGDNSYGVTSIDTNIGKYYADYMGSYTGSYGVGATSNAFFPAPGNHDYSDGHGIVAYKNYFTLPGVGIPTSNTSGSELYYDFIREPVHFFVIDSNRGMGSDSSQRDWLQVQLAKSTSLWKIVYFHHPPFSSARHQSYPGMQWPFENWGATAVLNGHEHIYERIIKDDNQDGTYLPYFITGVGGVTVRDFNIPIPGSLVRYSADFGTMIIDASNNRIKFEFWSIAGGAKGTLIDT